jgi:general stress protein CsbA
MTLANLAAAGRLVGDILTANMLFANNALAFVSAIKRWAKLMMMTEAVVSLVIGILVIARAVSILK